MADTDTTGTDAGRSAGDDGTSCRDSLSSLTGRLEEYDPDFDFDFDDLRELEVDPREVEAALAGGLAGGFQAALVLQIHDTDAIREVGAVFGALTLDGGWLATTTLGLGNAYGAVVGVAFSIFLMPIWLTLVTDVSIMVPNLTGDGLFGVLAWTLYGGTLGLVYGLIVEYR